MLKQYDASFKGRYSGSNRPRRYMNIRVQGYNFMHVTLDIHDQYADISGLQITRKQDNKTVNIETSMDRLDRALKAIC